MGYACPVCGTPQRDAEHLANHLAFTAMLHGDPHESWLDDHAPGWADEDPGTLGDAVAPHAEETTYEEVFEDTAHDHGRGRPLDHGRPLVDDERPTGAGTGTPATDEATRAALAEARELTRAMREGTGADGEEGTSGDVDDGAGDDAGDDAAGEEKA